MAHTPIRRPRTGIRHYTTLAAGLAHHTAPGTPAHAYAATMAARLGATAAYTTPTGPYTAFVTERGVCVMLVARGGHYATTTRAAHYRPAGPTVRPSARRPGGWDVDLPA